MTYRDQFVVEVKCRGKFLRVIDDVVRLPFGSEYSLYLKNLSSKRASVKISIDGQDVLDYSSLIIDGNTSQELEGFLRGTSATNKFKFINKTKEIQDYRGDKIDDGIIRVEFAFEKPAPKLQILNEIHHYHHRGPFYWNYNNWFLGDSTVKYRSSGNSARGSSACSPTATKNTTDFSIYSNVVCDSLGISSGIGAPLADEGITVKGSECNQQFVYSSIGELEDSSVIIICLKGTTGNQPVEKPVTVSTKLKCSTCGRVWKSSCKFCPICGTFLE